jgi:hypothetical protein
MAETRKDALAAFDHFVEHYEAKYDKAVGCLKKIAMCCWRATPRCLVSPSAERGCRSAFPKMRPHGLDGIGGWRKNWFTTWGANSPTVLSFYSSAGRTKPCLTSSRA